MDHDSVWWQLESSSPADSEHDKIEENEGDWLGCARCRYEAARAQRGSIWLDVLEMPTPPWLRSRVLQQAEGHAHGLADR
jgi:hypothetical protein